jgi:TonB family protein
MSEPWKQWEGQIVNGVFRLGQYLGGGERSAIFLVEDAQREPQRAAIKLVPSDAGNAELQLSRWEEAAQLSHPHLMRLFEMGRCQLRDTEVLYLVMEYAEENLSQVLVDRPITPAEAREMLEPTLDALAYVHGKGFVHGHIKPSNIMAVRNELKLSSDRLCRIGASGVARATPDAYDPPELDFGIVAPAGDTWSLGVTLVEALTQHVPVWERTGHAEPDIPHTLPAPFLDLAQHCVRKDPQSRYTVAGIAARLGQTIPQTPATATPRAAFATRRYIVPAVALALGLAAILAGPRLLNRHPAAERTPSAVEQPKVEPKAERNPVTSGTPQSSPTSTREKAAHPGITPAPVRSEAGARIPAGGRTPGEVVHQVLPDVSRNARATIQGKVRVRVRVRVDASGSVVGAKLDSPGPSRYFAERALEAARRWKFGPPNVDGRTVSSEWMIRFEFGRTATRAFPVQIAH